MSSAFLRHLFSPSHEPAHSIPPLSEQPDVVDTTLVFFSAEELWGPKNIVSPPLSPLHPLDSPPYIPRPPTPSPISRSASPPPPQQAASRKRSFDEVESDEEELDEEQLRHYEALRMPPSPSLQQQQQVSRKRSREDDDDDVDEDRGKRTRLVVEYVEGTAEASTSSISREEDVEDKEEEETWYDAEDGDGEVFA